VLNDFLTLGQINGSREVLDLLNAIRVDHPQFVFVRSELKDFDSCVTPFSLEPPKHVEPSGRINRKRTRETGLDDRIATDLHGSSWASRSS
jgi:hypothetical protein